MNLSDRYLANSETLQLRTGLHPVVLNQALAMSAVLLCGALGTAYLGVRHAPRHPEIMAAIASILLVASVAVAGRAILRRASVTVLVTNRRVIQVRGLFARSVDEIQLAALQRVIIDQNVLGRFFNYGNVTLQAGNERPMVLRDIQFPLELQQALQDQRRHGDEVMQARA